MKTPAVTGRRCSRAAMTVTAFGLATVASLAFSSPSSATISLTGFQTAPLGSGDILQADEWNSSAHFQITSDGGQDFQVASSAIRVPFPGNPGAYPSMFHGLHWGVWSSNSGLPISVSDVASNPGNGKEVTSLSCTQVTSGTWDNGYDIWFNSDPNPPTNQTGSYLELMVWLSDHNAPPTLAPVASNVSIGGRTYNIYMSGTEAIYQLTPAVSSVTNLDLGPIVYDAMNTRHYVQSNWYLIDIEAGFEIWQGGNGLRVNSFTG